MATGAGRSRSDDILAVALAAGRTVADSATAAGVSETTAYNRLRTPEFAERVKELRRKAVEQAGGRLAEGMTEAADVLRKLLTSADEHVRFKAAKAVIELGTRVIDLEELADRMAELEEVVKRQERR